MVLTLADAYNNPTNFDEGILQIQIVNKESFWASVFLRADLVIGSDGTIIEDYFRYPRIAWARMMVDEYRKTKNRYIKMIAHNMKQYTILNDRLVFRPNKVCIDTRTKGLYSDINKEFQIPNFQCNGYILSCDILYKISLCNNVRQPEILIA